MRRNYDFGSAVPPSELKKYTSLESEPLITWREKVTAELSAEDKLRWNALRATLCARGANEVWSYPAAGFDMLPVLLAPAGTRHEFIDPRYKDLQKQDPRVRQHVLEPFENLGATGSLTQDNAEQLRLDLDDSTSIDFLPSLAEEHPSTGPVDVVYNNYVSWYKGPAPTSTLGRLKVHGLFIYGSRLPHTDRADHLLGVDDNLESFGFKKRDHVSISSLKIPAIEKANIARGQQLHLTLMEKERELTPEEMDVLQLNSYLEGIGNTIGNRAVYNYRKGLDEDLLGSDDLYKYYCEETEELVKFLKQRQNSQLLKKTEVFLYRYFFQQTNPDQLKRFLYRKGSARSAEIDQISETPAFLKQYEDYYRHLLNTATG